MKQREDPDGVFPSAGFGKTEHSRSRRPTPDGGGRSGEKRKGRYATEKSHAATTKTTAKKRPVRRGERNKKILLTILVLLLLIGIIVALVYLWPILFGANECTTLGLPPEYKAIICARMKLGKTCEFNVAKCDVACPVGYKIDEYGCIISCDCATSGLFESDVSFNEQTLQTLLAAYMTIEDHSFQLFSGSASKSLNIWTTDKIATMLRIPYVIADDLDPTVVTAIESAIQALRNNTCIDMVVMTNQPSFIRFVNGVGCSSAVGKTGGEQHIVLGPGCEDVGSVLHEIMHTLGFWHEHSRPDRDEHVRVMWNNVEEWLQHNFNTRSLETVFDFGSPYDTDSLMQGGGYAHSKDLFSPSMIDLKTEKPVQMQRDKISKEDKVEINSLYECYKGSFDSVPGAHWGQWSVIGLCSASCGSGVAYRVRECLDGDREIIFRPLCGSNYHKEEPCNAARCSPGLWGPWSPCDLTCGPGRRTRASCCGVNATYESEDCNMKTCTEPGESFWADWQEWGECLRTCGNGMRRRYRSCFDIFETNVENLRCPQKGTSHLEIEICAREPCPTYVPPKIGYWGEWGDWASCSRSCGPASHKRVRDCYSPNATFVDFCGSDSYELKNCNNTKCPEPAFSLWTPWGPWSTCSVTCGGGTRTRTRKCESSVPLTLETDCGESMMLLDEDSRLETCNNQDCNPKVTEWSEWGSWGECSSKCSGTMWRLRTCIGGDLGDPECPWDGIYESEPCNVNVCAGGRMAVNDLDLTGSHWATWYQWTECSKTCDGGMRERYRLCQTEDQVLSYDCHIRNGITRSYVSQTESCMTRDCPKDDTVWSAWSTWETCTVTCGKGIQKRNRRCLSKTMCEGPRLGSKVCIMAECKAGKTNEKQKGRNKGIFASEKLTEFFHGSDTAGGPGNEDWRWHREDDKWNPKSTSPQEGAGSLSASTTTTRPTTRRKTTTRTTTTRATRAPRIRTTRTTTRARTTTPVPAFGMFKRPQPWSRKQSFCGTTSRLYLGDFNGDGRKDMLCLSASGKIKISYANRQGMYEGADWEDEVGFCMVLAGMIYTVDFNGDGTDDLMCYQKMTGAYEVIYSYHGKFGGVGGSMKGQTPSGFCKSPGDVLYVTDMNFDGRGDLVCRGNSGPEQVIFNEQ